MVLSDRSIREELAAGRIVIEPLDPASIQPSSVDLHVDRYFRVFRNHTMGFIDVKQDQEDLTELVEVGEEDVFILHPGEFVLGSTAERVALPDDLVARLEGKSSLGRLGLLIHSSLPAGERVLVLDDVGLFPRPIEEIVRKRIEGRVVGFDPETFEVGYHQITGWYEGPPDRIFEIRLASGRSVRVTAGHNLFTLDRAGNLEKRRTGELRAGMHVAIPREIPDPPGCSTSLSLLSLAPEAAYPDLTVSGPTVGRALAEHGEAARSALVTNGFRHVEYYSPRRLLPLGVARLLPGLVENLGPEDRVGFRGARGKLPAVIPIGRDLAWLLGLYVAEGCRRRNQVTISNTDQAILDRTERVLVGIGVAVYRGPGCITALSTIFSNLIDWLDAGPRALGKKVPAPVFGWPRPLLDAFLEGFIDGDGSREATRTSLWSSSSQLVDDLLYLAARRGRRASASFRGRNGRHLYQISVPFREHKLLTGVPLPSSLLVALRHEIGLSQVEASRALGYGRPTDLNNIERRHGRDAIRLRTLRRLFAFYRSQSPNPATLSRLQRLAEGGLLWDRVVEVLDTGSAEPIYDIEVRPGGRPIENFVAGTGGVFVSNTAGFVDAGWDGHLTLELSNVANLPITIYPGMKIGQISFLRMSTPADAPYGSSGVGSKYQGQRGPTPSRYFENFRPRG